VQPNNDSLLTMGQRSERFQYLKHVRRLVFRLVILEKQFDEAQVIVLRCENLFLRQLMSIAGDQQDRMPITVRKFGEMQHTELGA
jgi:hypothetical protein